MSDQTPFSPRLSDASTDSTSQAAAPSRETGDAATETIERPKAIAGLTDEVVAAAVGGDARAIGVLFAVLNPRLTRYLGLMVGRDAEDVASDTWVEVMRSMPRYVGGADTIGAWVIGIGRNRALTHFRRAQSRPKTAVSVEEFTEILSAEQDTYQTVEDAMATAAAMSRISSLPKEQAEAVFLRTIVGLDAAGAGEVLGKTAGAVRTSAHRGLRRLEKELLAEAEQEATGEPPPRPPTQPRTGRRRRGSAGPSESSGRGSPRRDGTRRRR